MIQIFHISIANLQFITQNLLSMDTFLLWTQLKQGLYQSVDSINKRKALKLKRDYKMAPRFLVT